MMLIKTVVRPSMIPNAGLGCFSVDFVPKDALMWEFNPNFDRAYTQAELDALALPAQEFIGHYGYRFKGIYYLSCDDTHYINHSERPSMYSDEMGFRAYAAKDIYPGEEIVDDYRNFGETEEDHNFNLRWLRTVM
jgi:SET domain-containing protein